jgi:hypothetical protein
MSYIHSDIITAVQTRIKDTRFSSSTITDLLNDTQNDVFNEYRLPFMQASVNYTLTSGDSDITSGAGLPANYVQTLDLIATTNGIEQVIPYKEISLSDEANPDQDDQAANYPEYWYTYADTIRLYPKPAGAYTVTLRYYKKPTDLVDGTDVPDIPSEFRELLVVGAAYRVLQIKDNYDQAAIHQNKYDEILQKLVVKYSQPQVAGPFIMPVNVYPRPGNF